MRLAGGTYYLTDEDTRWGVIKYPGRHAFIVPASAIKDRLETAFIMNCHPKEYFNDHRDNWSYAYYIIAACGDNIAILESIKSLRWSPDALALASPSEFEVDW